MKMSKVTYVVDSAVHGFHSEWSCMFRAYDQAHDLNDALFEKIVMVSLAAKDWNVSPAEEAALRAEYRRQVFNVQTVRDYE